MSEASALINFSGRQRLPVVLQVESAECALACLSMISGWHGRHEDLVSLRQRYGCGCRGMALNDLLDTARELGMACRAVTCEMSDISSLSLPAILHWDFNHYVVLKSISRRTLTIHDPAVGARKISLAAASEHFTGVAVECRPVDSFETKQRRRLPGLLHYLGTQTNLTTPLTQLLLLSAILQLVALAMPLFMQIVVDEVLVRRDLDLLTVLAGGYLGLSVLAVFTRALRGWISIYLTNQLSLTLGTRLFHHMLALPPKFFTSRQMGDLVSRFSSLKPIQHFLANSSVTLVLDGVMAVTTLTVMFAYSPALSAVAFVFVAVLVLEQILFYAPLRRRQLESIAAEARADSNFMESVRSIGAIKRFCMEASRCNDWQNRYVDSVNAQVRLGRLSLGADLVQHAVTGMGNILVIYLGARQVLSGELSIGMLYAFMAWRNHLSGAAASLVNALVKYLMLSLHLERLADISEATPEQRQESGVNDSPIEGALMLRDGGFRYSRRDPWIFRHVDLCLCAGDALAVIGPSGCGKSTFLSVMMRMMPMNEGDLWIDGRHAGAVGTGRLRRNCASVMQEDTLLSGSIGSNITFGDTAPEFARMRKVARIAGIDNDIMRLPMGYESRVGEMGASLSAGQVQRILIARALYREPRILFLDEGTAHLDKVMEFEVMKRLLSLGMTCIFTTHNRSVLPLADKVLVLSNDGYRIKRPPRERMPSVQKQSLMSSVECPESTSVSNPSAS